MLKCKQKVLKSSQNIIKVPVSILKLDQRENINVFAPEFGSVIVSIGHLAAHDLISPCINISDAAIPCTVTSRRKSFKAPALGRKAVCK